MSRHRILIVGPPASGRGWMAERIDALTGIPLEDEPDLDAREWMRIEDRADVLARVQPQADLVVLMVTPLWLRWLRLVWRVAGAPRLWSSLPARLVGTRRWEREARRGVLPLLERGPGRLIKVRSSENARTVLECVLGLDGPGPMERVTPSG